MPIINSTTRPLMWAVTNASGTAVLVSDIMEAGGMTVSGLPIISDESENAFLGKVAGKAGSYNPLPAAGVWLEAGEIYGYGGGLVMVRQSHTRTEHAPADVPALFTVYRANAGDVLDWVSGERVEVGTRRTYGGKTWEALQAHQTQSDWQPPNVPALWREVVVTPPTGAWAFPVAYKVGDLVTYQGNTYSCRQAHTSISTWTPSAVPALWLRV